jgi:hypothetical protein
MFPPAMLSQRCSARDAQPKSLQPIVVVRFLADEASCRVGESSPGLVASDMIECKLGSNDYNSGKERLQKEGTASDDEDNIQEKRINVQ